MRHIPKHWHVMRNELDRNRFIGHFWNAFTVVYGGGLLAAYFAVWWVMSYAFTPWRARIVSGLVVVILFLLFLARCWRTYCDEMLRLVPTINRLAAYIQEGEKLKTETERVNWSYDESFKWRLDCWNHGANDMLLDIGGSEFRKRFYEGLVGTEKPQNGNEVELWVHNRNLVLKSIMAEISPKYGKN